MGFKFAWEPSNEGFTDKLIYAFTTDDKILETISLLPKLLKTKSDTDILELIPDVSVIPYTQITQMLDVTEFFVDNTNDLFTAIANKKSKQEVFNLLADFEKKLRQAFPGDKINKLFAYSNSAKYESKSLKDLGYTKTKLLHLIERVSSVINEQKDLIKKIKKYSGFFAAIKYGSELSSGRTVGISLYTAKNIPVVYKFMKHLLFYLARKLKD